MTATCMHSTKLSVGIILRVRQTPSAFGQPALKKIQSVTYPYTTFPVSPETTQKVNFLG